LYDICYIGALVLGKIFEMIHIRHMKFPVEMILRDPFSILKQPLLREWFRRGWDRWVYIDGTPVVLPDPNQLELF